jgi:protein required for attachment to host cells
MSKLWVVVADQSKARIFTVDDPRGPLRVVEELEHPQGRERDQALNSDKPGRAFDSKGHGRHSMGTAVEPGRQEAIRFAKQVADHVQSAHNSGHCNRLLLVAGPSLLGLLRENLKSVSGMDIAEVEKNLGQYDAAEIRKHLPARL